jgi:flagellar hook protein FlgE
MRFLQIGVSGLKVEGEALGVAGDNIANVNTPGFKRQRANFEDVFFRGASTFGGGGVRIGGIEQAFTQGALVQTGLSTDLAINGDGFFAVRGNMGGVVGDFYSRAGQFHLDPNGYLVDPSGLQLLGSAAEPDGTIQASVGPIKVPTAAMPATQTSEITMVANLDSAAPQSAPFDLTNPEGTSVLGSSVVVYDSLGAPHDVNIYWSKTGENAWEYRAVVKGDDLVGGVPGENVEVGSGSATFTSTGALDQFTEGTPITVDFAGAAPGQTMGFSVGTPIADGGSGLDGMTQFSMDSSVSSQSQDGSSSGDLTGISVQSDGLVLGQFTNGRSIAMAEVQVAKFASPGGLGRAGAGLWVATAESGDAVLGAPGGGGRGSLSSGAVESSNVEIADEMVSMMKHQRAYSANSKVLTTADDMLAELMQLKR